MIQINHPTLPTGRFIQDQLGDHDVVYQPSKDSGPWNPIIVQDHAVGDYWIIDAGGVVQTDSWTTVFKIDPEYFGRRVFFRSVGKLHGRCSPPYTVGRVTHPSTTDPLVILRFCFTLVEN